MRLARDLQAAALLDLPSFNEDRLYANPAWLTDNQDRIEDSLFTHRYQDKAPKLYLYDVTSTYHHPARNPCRREKTRRLLRHQNQPPQRRTQKRSRPYLLQKPQSTYCLIEAGKGIVLFPTPRASVSELFHAAGLKWPPVIKGHQKPTVATKTRLPKHRPKRLK